MAGVPELSVQDFFALGNDAAERTAALKVRLAEAGIVERRLADNDDEGDADA